MGAKRGRPRKNSKAESEAEIEIGAGADPAAEADAGAGPAAEEEIGSGQYLGIDAADPDALSAMIEEASEPTSEPVLEPAGKIAPEHLGELVAVAVRELARPACAIARVARLSDDEVASLSACGTKLLLLYGFDEMDERTAAWVSLAVVSAGIVTPRLREFVANRRSPASEPSNVREFPTPAPSEE